MEQRKTIRKKFTFELSEKEKAKKAMQLSEMMNVLHLMESDFFGVKKDYTIRIKDMREKVGKIARLINAGTEEREVDAEEVFNHDEEIVSYLYRGKVIHTREMTPEEKQLSLTLYPPFVEPEAFKPIDRKCNRCDEKFTARHKYHRTCETCVKHEVHRFGEGA